jgi:hypothetical protein
LEIITGQIREGLQSVQTNLAFLSGLSKNILIHNQELDEKLNATTISLARQKEVYEVTTT